jgi:hypothetical protein
VCLLCPTQSTHEGHTGLGTLMSGTGDVHCEDGIEEGCEVCACVLCALVLSCTCDVFFKVDIYRQGVGTSVFYF